MDFVVLLSDFLSGSIHSVRTDAAVLCFHQKYTASQKWLSVVLRGGYVPSLFWDVGETRHEAADGNTSIV